MTINTLRSREDYAEVMLVKDILSNLHTLTRQAIGWSVDSTTGDKLYFYIHDDCVKVVLRDETVILLNDKLRNRLNDQVEAFEASEALDMFKHFNAVLDEIVVDALMSSSNVRGYVNPTKLVHSEWEVLLEEAGCDKYVDNTFTATSVSGSQYVVRAQYDRDVATEGNHSRAMLVNKLLEHKMIALVHHVMHSNLKGE